MNQGSRTSEGREAKMEGKGRMESGGKMRALLLRKGKKEVDRREGREEEGICRTNVKVLPTPLISVLLKKILPEQATSATA